MKIGTRIPPPVHANTILTNLKLSGASGFILLNTLFPKNDKRLTIIRNYGSNLLPLHSCRVSISKKTYRGGKCIQANTSISALRKYNGVSDDSSKKCRRTIFFIIIVENQKYRLTIACVWNKINAA